MTHAKRENVKFAKFDAYRQAAVIMNPMHDKIESARAGGGGTGDACDHGLSRTPL